MMRVTDSAQRSDQIFFGHPMMYMAGANPGFFWLWGIFSLVTWILIIAVLIALFRWLWKEGEKRR